ncbi:MAG: polysaccharide deacetylase family protein [Gammaproteobacteria bacterium]
MNRAVSDFELRDFRGYAGNPPAIQWPGGAWVALSIVLNLEEGAELSLGAGDERNESVHEVVSRVEGVRDLCMESHFEYGARAGYWRIVELLERFSMTCTVNACVRALETTPWIVDDVTRRGYEVMCHGYRWEGQEHLSEAEERELIERCARSIEAMTGRRPQGWHSKSYPSTNTRRLLVEAGFSYDSNAYNDDLPYVVDVDGRRHVIVPYSFDTNDMRFQAGGGFEFGDDFARYCIDAFECLLREGEGSPRMMTVGLHTRIIGRPGRIGGLEKFLQHVVARGHAWVTTRAAIAQAWREAAEQ